MIEITNDKASQFYNIALERLKVIWEQPADKFSDIEPKSVDELVFFLGCIFGQSKKNYDEYKALARIIAASPEFLQIAIQMYQELFAYLAPGDERIEVVMNLVEKVHTVIMGELEAEYGFEINKVFMPLGFTSAMIDACLEEDKTRFEAELGTFKTIETLNLSHLQAIAIICLVENHVNCKVSERMADISECDLSEISKEAVQLEYNRHIFMYRSIKELMEKMSEESLAWSTYCINYDLQVESSKELDPIVRILLVITAVCDNWNNQLYNYFRELSPSYTVPSPKRQQLYEMLNDYSYLISKEYKAYCIENNVGEPLNKLFDSTESDSEHILPPKLESASPDYKGYYVSQSPDVSYDQMKSIAWRLAGKVRDGASIKSSDFFYIDAKDVDRLCYFFIKNVKIDERDFDRPLKWYGNWDSYWYFVLTLYGNRRIPGGLKESTVLNFRFNLKRNKGKEKGQISMKTFNSYKLDKIPKEVITRINKIIREEVVKKE